MKMSLLNRFDNRTGDAIFRRTSEGIAPRERQWEVPSIGRVRFAVEHFPLRRRKSTRLTPPKRAMRTVCH
jgi:hypothetical protein